MENQIKEEELKTAAHSDEPINDPVKEPTESVSEPTDESAEPPVNPANINQSLLARAETINITLNLLNAWLAVRQEDETKKISDKELAAIQTAVDREIAKSEQLYAQLQAYLKSTEETSK